MKMDEKKIKIVGRVLLENHDEFEDWPWLNGALKENRAATKEEANNFFIGAMMDRQMPSDAAWKNTEELTQEFLGNPANIWEEILSMPESEWNLAWQKRKFHRFVNRMSKCIRDNAKIMVSEYQSDARKIWQHQSGGEIKENLEGFSGIGPALSDMILGALQDTKQINTEKPLNVKADVHVCRVLGRVFQGDSCESAEAICLTKKMHPKNPWALDNSLYWLGKNRCFAKNPNCKECYLAEQCEYNKRN
ncbi:MAG: hypothetical protein ACR2PV_02995 [Gammaproteobacteria bacterium]